MPAEQTVTDYGVLLDRARGRLGGGRRVLLGITGAPGAGKSTVAERLVADLGPVAALVPMDGFHRSNAELDRLGLRCEKGSPRTFDGAAYVALLRRLKAVGCAGPVTAPAFDRVTDEPVPDGLVVPAQAELVVTEGNYLLLDQPPWRDLRDLLDEVWFCAADQEQRLAQLVTRHVRFGRSPEAATAWANGPDAANATLVLASAGRADLRFCLGRR